ncbi:MAG TPA: hypoxanthine phosphoribosyltransferase [Vicinamibacteria bacterium]|nr:hypoxanthine phosphoribosyltransferase [Vicinamibacteria bacterium]
MSFAPADALFSAEQIKQRVAELGAEITAAFDGHDLSVVTLLKSGMVFMADLIRQIPLDTTCHFLRVASTRDEGAVRTDIVYSTEIRYGGRHVLIVDDIVDTGITLAFLLDHIRLQKPSSLKVCALIDKPGERKTDVHPDWAAFTIAEPEADRFLVGYGLDYAERYRGLPYIGTIPRPATRAAVPGDLPGVFRK